MKTGNAAIAVTLLLLAACKEQPATVVSTIPKEYWGRYTGRQPDYILRDKEGKPVEFNGSTILIGATKETVDVNGDGIAWQQELLTGLERRTVTYDRVVPTTLESTKDHLLVECSFTASEGKSTPDRRFRFDLKKRTITMLGDRGSADCILSRQ